MESKDSRQGESPKRKSFLVVIAIPIAFLLLWGFKQRRKYICIQTYGPDECSHKYIGKLYLLALAFCCYYLFSITSKKINEIKSN